MVRQQVFDHAGPATARGLQPRRARQCIACFQVGAGGQQHVDDVDMAGQRSFVQRTAALAVARIGAGLVLEQQLHTGRVVFFSPGRGQQHGRALGRLGLGPAFEQELGQPPVADLAGHGQRRPAVIIERVHFRGGIAQQRGDTGIGTARRVMQRRVALAVHRARVGAIGEQGHHRLGATVPTVAGSGQQRGHATVRGIDAHAARDQFAQQAQVGQHRGQHGQAALVAPGRIGQPVRVGAGLQQLQGTIDPAAARRVVQRRLLFVQADRFQRFGLGVRVGEQIIAVTAGLCRYRCAQGRCGGNRLQQHVRQRGQQYHCSGDRPVQRRRNQARPRRQHHQRAHQHHQRSNGQPAPGGQVASGQGLPVTGQAAFAAFHVIPQRPGPPDPEQRGADRHAHAEHGGQAAAVVQGTQRPGHQQGQQQRAQPPQRQQRRRILTDHLRQRLQRAGAAPPRDRQRERRLGQCGAHGTGHAADGRSQSQQRTEGGSRCDGAGALGFNHCVAGT